jgi:hypothetical protein
MTPLSRRPAPAACLVIDERLPPDPTLHQKIFLTGPPPSVPASVMWPVFAEVIAAATGYEKSDRLI